jgi:PAS domain S-box-containing protein
MVMQGERKASSSILNLLKINPKGLTISDVSRKLCISRNSVAKYLEILAAEGKIEARNFGPSKVYSVVHRIPLSAFLCFTKNMILVLDKDFNILQANDQYLALLGWTKKELLGKNLLEDDLPIVTVPEAMEAVRAAGKEQIIRDIPYLKNGRELFYKMEVIPTTFESGEKGLTIVLEDITEQKRYLRNMEFLERTARELVDLPLETDIYHYIAERIIELLPRPPRVYVESYDEVNRQFVKREIIDRTPREGGVRIMGKGCRLP